MIINNDEIIEVIPNLESPDEIARNFFHDRDIKLVENKIEDLKQVLLMMTHNNNRLQHQFNELWDKNWENNQLQEMKQNMEKAIKERNYGFPLTEEECDKTYKWQRQHDTEVHFNPEGYHGASGGGFTYSFYPTGLGTTCNCFCNSCKQRAIKEAGEKWYDRCKELGGVFEVIGWNEAF